MYQDHKGVVMETESLMDFMEEDEKESPESSNTNDEALKELERALTKYDYPSCMSGI